MVGLKVSTLLPKFAKMWRLCPSNFNGGYGHPIGYNQFQNIPRRVENFVEKIGSDIEKTSTESYNRSYIDSKVYLPNPMPQGNNHCCLISFLWSPYGIGRPYIFSCCGLFFILLLLVLLLFSSPNLSRRRLDVCHTSTHGVALVRI